MSKPRNAQSGEVHWDEFPGLLDDYAIAISLRLPSSKVVALQAYLELYEGVGFLRTRDVRNSLVTVLTTPTSFQACREMLEALRAEIGWELIPHQRDPKE